MPRTRYSKFHYEQIAELLRESTGSNPEDLLPEQRDALMERFILLLWADNARFNPERFRKAVWRDDETDEWSA